MSAVDVLAVVPEAPSSRPTWQIAEKAGVSPTRALRELRALEDAGLVRLKATQAVNRSSLQRYFWQLTDAALARMGGKP
jgi:DNA-binding IclR family transcriptional regulator